MDHENRKSLEELTDRELLEYATAKHGDGPPAFRIVQQARDELETLTRVADSSDLVF